MSDWCEIHDVECGEGTEYQECPGCTADEKAKAEAREERVRQTAADLIAGGFARDADGEVDLGQLCYRIAEREVVLREEFVRAFESLTVSINDALEQAESALEQAESARHDAKSATRIANAARGD
jgi:hypothetical protein